MSEKKCSKLHLLEGDEISQTKKFFEFDSIFTALQFVLFHPKSKGAISPAIKIKVINDLHPYFCRVSLE